MTEPGERVTEAELHAYFDGELSPERRRAGIGRLVFQAIANRDLVVVRDVVLLLVAMVVIVNFVVDVLYAVIDPRLKPSDA